MNQSKEDVYGFLPIEVEEKYDCMQIDEKYISMLSVIDYTLPIKHITFIQTFLKQEAIDYTINIEKLEVAKVLNELTKTISTTKAEMKTVSKNQVDIDVIEKLSNRATCLRKAIQVENQQVYLVAIYICIIDESQQKLKLRQKKLINEFYTRGLVVLPLNFRQKEAYNNSILKVQDKIKGNKKIYTGEGTTCLFPYFSQQLCMEQGVLIGKVKGTPAVINIMGENNNNYNMCIFGSSGTGKSFFVKTYILRNAYMGIKQFVFDVEREYLNIAEKIGGSILNEKNINPLYIPEEMTQTKDFLATKILRLYKILNMLGSLNEDEQYIKESLAELYKEYGINEDRHSCFEMDNEHISTKMKYKQQNKFPTLFDYLLKLDKNKSEQAKRIVKTIKKEFKKYVTKRETCLHDSTITVFDLSNQTSEEKFMFIYIAIQTLKDRYKSKHLIYFDELWKYLSCDRNSVLSNEILEMYKSLRKQQAGIVCITQDIADIFVKNSGDVGKVLLNNSYLKMIFKLEYMDFEHMDKMFEEKYSKSVQSQIKTLERGTCLVDMGGTTFKLEIEATQKEKELIG